MKAPQITFRQVAVSALLILLSCLPVKAQQCTATYVIFNAYTAVIGGAISGEDVYRIGVTENCGGVCCDDPYTLALLYRWDDIGGFGNLSDSRQLNYFQREL